MTEDEMKVEQLEEFVDSKYTAEFIRRVRLGLAAELMDIMTRLAGR